MRTFLLAICISLLPLASYAINKEFDYLFATDSWPPYYGATLKDGGFFSVIVKEAYRIQGKKVRILYTSWKRAFELTKQGKYEGILGIYYLPEREKYFLYSSAITHSKQYLFSKISSNISFKTLQDLSPYRIGIVRGYHYSDEFDKADYLSKHEEVSTKKVIKLLLLGRLELIAADRRVMKYYVSTKYHELVNKYKEHPLMLKSITVHLAISKAIPNVEQLHQEFEAGFAIMKKQGLDKAIMLKYGFSP
ncbi:substrate-binding periplasmic protein [Spartinivicinus poritis]|uniref:Transporter substrate-binding domain-containing protein n=1 Tax=Spartinivicinus poritis TaxID=2994640 RepID=A0ABT5U386_9GAMM|nr:transporter substrate-binding domain-containing protein [Spartinivicinus sp. A2-2]MDE1460772.1 transporter substrate-binding domain-containing protein [Spartinivicinus sp. A2-2]